MAYFGNIAHLEEQQAIVEHDGTSVSYSELSSASDFLASMIGRRTLAFILCTNTIASVVGYVGFLRNDIVPVLVDSELDPELLQKLIRTYEPAYIWSPEARLQHLSGTVVHSYSGYSLLRTKIGRASCRERV